MTDRLASDARDHLLALYRITTDTAEDAVVVQREVGWVEAIEHLSERGGLSHAGRVEAEKLLDASREWARGYLEDEGPGR